MHVVLTNAFNAGDFDGGKTYANVCVREINVSVANSTIAFRCEWGNWNGSTWTDVGTKASSDYYSGADFTAIMETVSNTDEKMCETLERAILEKLVADGKLAGTVATGG